MIDKDGSGEIDMEEFKMAMAVIMAVNKAEVDEDSDDEVGQMQTGDKP